MAFQFDGEDQKQKLLIQPFVQNGRCSVKFWKGFKRRAYQQGSRIENGLIWNLQRSLSHVTQ